MKMRCFPRLWLVAALGLVLVWTTLVPAQRRGDLDQLGEVTDVSKFTSRRIEFDNYLKGTRSPPGDAKEFFELASRYYVFRVTWFASIQPFPDRMEKVRSDFKHAIGIASAPDSKNNQDAVKLWSPMLVSAFKQVLQIPLGKNRQGVLNAAVLLPDLARLKRPEIADFLVSLVENPKQHDLVKRYAAKGLAEFFPAREFIVSQDKGNKALEDRKQSELKRVNAMLSLVSRQWNAGPEVDKKYTDAFCFVRAKCIKALGEARVPALVADAKTQKLEGAIINALLPILTKDAVKPEPTLEEKIEAAIAIGLMKVDPNSAYLPEEGIYRVGTVLVEIADVYRADYNRTAGTGKGKYAPPSILPWKLHARRLQIALGEMVNSVANDNLRTNALFNARKLRDASQRLLDAMQQTPAQANYNTKDLADVVNTLRPKSAQIFKGFSAAPAPAAE